MQRLTQILRYPKLTKTQTNTLKSLYPTPIITALEGITPYNNPESLRLETLHSPRLNNLGFCA